MAKVVKHKNHATRTRGAQVTSPGGPLTIRLSDPGMTPLLRAGLGGLAASARALLLEGDRSAIWPSPIAIGPGTLSVDATSVTLDWGAKAPEETLKPLFERSFRLRAPYGLIEVPGHWDSHHAPDLALLVAVQAGLKRTFLQHGAFTRKAGLTKTVPLDVDDRQHPVTYQPYADYAHRRAGPRLVSQAVSRGTVKIAGWVYPGAARRHNAFGATWWALGPGAALCGCFALVGCLSYPMSRGGGGALVIVEPRDLIRFAEVRSRLTPRRPADAYIAGIGDAVLAVELALRMEAATGRRDCVVGNHGILLRTTPWAPQQKSRVHTLSSERYPDDVLDLYERVAKVLPSRVLTRERAEAEEEGDEGDVFFAASALRAFATDNLAAGRKWFEGFASATTMEKRPRFIHYFRDQSGGNLGALYSEERRGLLLMTKCLEEAELASIPTACLRPNVF